ncbi:MAG: hypothetical protein IPP49_16790 [Saprospiraceae bacterium]|nr:hypothetical protein [Saprospiraceae bacterium]
MKADIKRITTYREYLQKIKWSISKFTILTGLRYYRFGDYGWKLTPRLLVRAHLSETQISDSM